jgi:hypothetical protein
MYICIIINSDRIYKLRFYLRLYSGILFENDTHFIRYAYSQTALFFLITIADVTFLVGFRKTLFDGTRPRAS